PASWTLLEWVRSWFFTGFPWLSLGYAAVGWPLHGYAPLLGVFGLSFLTLSLSGMLWLAWRSARRVPAIVAFFALIGGGVVLNQVEWTAPVGEPVSVALLQGNVAQDLKFLPERYSRTLETYAQLAEGTKAQLIVLP